MKKVFISFIILSIGTICLGVTNSVFFTNAGGGKVGQGFWGIGGEAAGKISSANYLLNAGGIAFFALTSASLEAPIISNVKINNLKIISGDYISSSGVLTATITDETTLNLSLSSVEVNGSYTSFSNLSGNSSYDAASGLLTFAFAGLPEGNNTIGIHAFDSDGNITSLLYNLKVDTGTVKITEVLCLPNPFNPKSGSAKISYYLNHDSDTTLYIFNALGELVFKQVYPAGAEGGHISYNEVEWKGVDSAGNMVGNDLYFIRIVTDGKVIGKGKVAILK